MRLVNKFFNAIWDLQCKIIKLSKSFNDFVKIIYKPLIKFCTTVGGIIALIIFFLIYINYTEILQIFLFAFIILVIVLLIVPVINVFLNCYTSLRNFFLVSVVFNLILFYILYIKSFLWAGLVCAFLFVMISIVANTDVATTANTIIEILLALATTIKGVIINWLYNFFNTDILGQIDKELISLESIEQAAEYYSIYERNISNSIDSILYPLLVINGLAILATFLHSYWIKKYNDGKQISWKDIKNLYP